MKQWVEIELAGVTWLVAGDYVAPVGIGEAVELARAQGCELPSPALVDAIWRAADLRLEPHPRGPKSKPPCDYTTKTLDSGGTHMAQGLWIAGQIGESCFDLVAGHYKDVAISKGKVGLYGWHRLDGTIIQPFFGGHALAWRDYSQGLRLVKKKVR